MGSGCQGITTHAGKDELLRWEIADVDPLVLDLQWSVVLILESRSMYVRAIC